MLLLGHLGIGKRLTRPFSNEIPALWIYLGTVLPDLIDKPLYFLATKITGHYGESAGLISSTRTFGHSGILLILLSLLMLRGSTRFTALSLGFLTHIFLDVIGDSWELFDASATTQAVLFPLLGFKFFASPFQSFSEHWESKLTPLLLSLEVLGASLLCLDAYEFRRRK